MDNNQVFGQLFEADIRLDNIVWLGGAVDGFSDSDFFEEVILDAHEGAAYLHETMKVFRDAPDWAMESKDSFVEWMVQSGIYGFVVQATTPKPIKFHDNGAYSTCGFGYTCSTYIYVEHISEAVPLALEWRKEKMQQWRAEMSEEECSPAPM